MSSSFESDRTTGGPQTAELDSRVRGGALLQVDRVVLVGNYARDRQHSMLRFADLMNRELNVRGIAAQVVQPGDIAARRMADVQRGLGKWLAYVDKLCLFPVKLRLLARRSSRRVLFHICDHSNAPYVRALRGRSVVGTAHDLLAVRGGLGDEGAMCPASRMGRLLQRRILAGLKTVPWIGCDSESTRRDLLRLTGRTDAGRIRTIHLAADPRFGGVPDEVAVSALRGLMPEPAGSYLLHVGSSQPRKNREAVLRVMETLRDRWSGRLVLAGEGLSPAQREMAERMGLRDRILELSGIDDSLLKVLYTNAHALIFPSHAEGFGWPVLEAQACGCPVICSNRTSLPEVAGAGGMVFETDDIAGMSGAVLQLEGSNFRKAVVSAGLENAGSFSVDRMMDAYLDLYRSAMNSRGSSIS